MLRRIVAGVHSGTPTSRRRCVTAPPRASGWPWRPHRLAPIRLMLLLVLRRRREGVSEKLREGHYPDAEDGASTSVGGGRMRTAVAARRPAGAVEVHV
jgi:hypothetical protein